jgi:hypothetical protein
VSSSNTNARRRYGTGTLTVRRNAFYGQWRVDGRQVMRKLGPIREPGARDGLTKTMAEKRLREEMAKVAPPVVERVTVKDAGDRLVAHLEALGRKPATIEAYESIVRVHLAPFFAGRALSSIEPEDIERFIRRTRKTGHATKSILNYLGVLHGIFQFALRRRWVTTNPCKLVDRPRPVDTDATVRFISTEEVAVLVDAVPDDDLGAVERVMYLAGRLRFLPDHVRERMRFPWNKADSPQPDPQRPAVDVLMLLPYVSGRGRAQRGSGLRRLRPHPPR